MHKPRKMFFVDRGELLSIVRLSPSRGDSSNTQIMGILMDVQH